MADAPGTMRRWWWVPSVGVLALLAWVVVGRWDQLPTDGALPSLAAGAVAVACHVAGNLLLGIAWHRQLVLAGADVAVGPTVAVWSSSQLSRFVAPGATFAARPALARRLGVPVATGAVTTVFELGWTLLAHPVVALACLPWWTDLPDALRWVGAAALVPAAVLVALVASPARAARGLAAVLRRLPGIGRRVPSDDRVAEADLRPADAAVLAVLHLANVLLRHLAFLVLVGSLVSLDGRVAAVLGASAVGRFVGLVSVFAPAGLGPREGMTVLAAAPAIGTAVAGVAVAATRVAEVVAEAVVWGATRSVAPARQP